MAKKDGIDAKAEEILRILETSPDSPATQARQAIQQAIDAGGGGLRQEYLKDAQRHIARIDPRQEPGTVQRLQAEVLALQGRGGDTKIAHLTPGELVIPRSLLTPELVNMLAAVAREHGVDPRVFFVGSGRNNINPRTGQMEFADEQDGDPLPPLQSLEGFQPPKTSLLPEPGSPQDRAFQFTDIPTAGPLIYAEAGNQPGEVKQGVMNSMLSRVGAGYGMPNTLAGVMSQTQKDGVTHQYEGMDNQKYNRPLDQMNAAEQRSWIDSMAAASNGIIDAKMNGVDYGPRFFHDGPQFDEQGNRMPARKIEFEDRQPPGAQYRNPFPKRW
jgi:hypothetical protein